MKRILFTIICIAILFPQPIHAAPGAKSYRVIDMDRAYVYPGSSYLREYRDLPELDAAISDGRLSFTVYSPNRPPKTYPTFSRASDYAHGNANAFVTYRGRLWPDIPFGIEPDTGHGAFSVFQNNAFLKSFDIYSDAVDYAQRWPDAVVAGEMVVAHNFVPVPEHKLHTIADYIEFDTLVAAVAYARESGRDGKHSAVLAMNAPEYDHSRVIWENVGASGGAMIEGVPFVSQLPELPRGCEVTALTMLINHRGLMVDKLTLAEELTKSPFEHDDPNNGFVGSMHSLQVHGLGVYHAPVAALARDYMPKEIVDMTGCEFEDLLYFLDRGRPVWILTNTRYRPLSGGDFATWQTPDGPVRVTYRMHSVLVVGYDDRSAYFHDPLTGAYKKEPLDGFIGGWVQMGRQAISTIN